MARERREYLRNFAREYRKTEKSKEYDRQYRSKYNKTFRGVASKLYSAAARRAKLQKLDFDLTSTWVVERLTPMLCEATGTPLSLEIDEDCQHTFNRPSIDRIDNNKGYTKDNCQIACVMYNKAKSDGHHEDVIAMAQHLLEKVNGYT